MRGGLYSVSYDGKTVTEYLDINAPGWNIGVQFQGIERGFQSFAFHPQFNQRGARGYGKFYTYTRHDQHDAGAGLHVRRDDAHARYGAARMDGEESRGRDMTAMRRRKCFAPRSRSRTTTPERLRSNPTDARQTSADFGLLYVGFADGGSGGDPMNLAQNLAVALWQDPSYRSARPPTARTASTDSEIQSVRR
jgi:hypothetical protein